MPRKRLTAQDAFVGVRHDSAEKQAAKPAPEAPPPAEAEETSPAEVGEDPAPARQTKEPSRRAKPRADRQLQAALREAQKAAAARTAVERLTLYLSPGVSEPLTMLWEEVREGAQVKVGKSLLAAAALRIVLSDPELRARAAADALREKLGGTTST